MDSSGIYPRHSEFESFWNYFHIVLTYPDLNIRELHISYEASFMVPIGSSKNKNAGQALRWPKM